MNLDLQWFAEGGEERTEEATESKLRKARLEGRVAKSQELNGTLVFLFVSVTLVLLGSFFLDKICEVFKFYLSDIMNTELREARLYYVFIRYLLIIVLPLSLVGIIAGVIANVVQNKGWLVTLKTIEPKFDKLIPKFGEYFKRTLFSALGVFNFFKSIFKVFLITLIAYAFIRKDLNTTKGLMSVVHPMIAVKIVGVMVAKLLIVSSILLLIISVFDYFMQKKDFLKNMKMTKYEVKQESKEEMGDPQVKSRLEQAQRQLLSQNMPKAVKEADVLITNPTHYAISLQWKKQQNDAPVVTSKGVDDTAQTMKKIAREAGVPIIENRPLARGLYGDVQVGDQIPPAYLKAIATVYAQIGYMDRQQRR